MRAFRLLLRKPFLFHEIVTTKATNAGTLASRSFRRSNHYRLPLQDIRTQRPRHATYKRISSRGRLFSSKPPNINETPKYDPTPNLNSPPGQPSLSLSQRLRKLSREYGWSAVGVYLLLTAIDLPFCFIAVRSVGTEKIGEWEHTVVQWVKRAVPVQIPPAWRRGAAGDQGQGGPAGDGVEKVEGIAGHDHGVLEAERSNKGDSASIYTQLALAYAIHKSFIFIRVPLTAAVTPKVVRVLRGWGWDIGKRKPKA